MSDPNQEHAKALMDAAILLARHHVTLTKEQVLELVRRQLALAAEKGPTQ